MRFHRLFAVFVLSLPVFAADPPMPELRVEAEKGGSVFDVKNTHTQTLSAFTVELVDVKDESFSFTRDELGANALAAGTEKKIRVANTTAGEMPDHVKMVAAIYADGSAVGAPEKVNHILDLRRARLKNTREIIARIEMDEKGGKDKDAIVADLRQWATTIVPPPPPGMQPITDPAKTVLRNMIVVAAGQVNTKGMAEELSNLKKTESELAASKPSI